MLGLRCCAQFGGPLQAYLVVDPTADTPGVGYGNFDIIFDHLSRIPQLFTISHAPCAIIYLVTMLIGC